MCVHRAGDLLARHDLTFDAGFAQQALDCLTTENPAMLTALSQFRAAEHLLRHVRSFDYEVPKDSASALCAACSFRRATPRLRPVFPEPRPTRGKASRMDPFNSGLTITSISTSSVMQDWCLLPVMATRLSSGARGCGTSSVVHSSRALIFLC